MVRRLTMYFPPGALAPRPIMCWKILAVLTFLSGSRIILCKDLVSPYFLTVPKLAEGMEVPARTVRRDWKNCIPAACLKDSNEMPISKQGSPVKEVLGIGDQDTSCPFCTCASISLWEGHNFRRPRACLHLGCSKAAHDPTPPQTPPPASTWCSLSSGLPPIWGHPSIKAKQSRT